MHIHSSGLTDKGRVRDENQDAYLIDRKHQVFAVADGLGGLPGGGDASRRVIELLRARLDEIQAPGDGLDLPELIIGINQVIAKEASEAYPFTGSGSTLTLCRILGDHLHIGHVGDSAAYLFREGQLRKLTTDHTMEQKLIDEEGESARKYMPLDYPHTLTRCLGQLAEFRVDLVTVSLHPKDRVILCTDGLNKVVPEAEIAEILASEASPEAICSQLTIKANANFGPDNITVITLLMD